jgi:endonuclease/exonuclease/phosphatase family metal-dependent hydrolase
VSLRLLSYNIRSGGLGREEHLARVIEDCAPDLVVFQEATHPPVIERLAAKTGMTTWAAVAKQSLAFMSRVAIAHHEWHRPALSRRPFLEIALAETNVRVFGLHLTAVHSNWTERQRLRELQALLNSIARHQTGFHVLVGDFNTLAPGELLDIRRLPRRLRALVWLGGPIKWHTIELMLKAHYIDGYRLLHPNQEGFTFPTWDPHVRLDYLFIPETFVGHLTACHVVNGPDMAKTASDHFPLLASLRSSDD